MELERGFKGIWIPREIYLNQDLSPTEKILLAEVESLDKGEGCYASNKYFAQFLKISEGQCANVLTSLRKKGLLITKRFDGRTRWLSLNPDFRKTGTLPSGKPEPCLQENLNPIYKEDINYINNKEEINPEVQKKASSPPKKLTDEEWISQLKRNPAYKHIDFDREFGKMDAWFSIPRNSKRQRTRQFILNWLNKADPGVFSAQVSTSRAERVKALLEKEKGAPV